MSSKELNEIINKTRRTSNISLTLKQAKEIIKDLEMVEILKETIKNNVFDVAMLDDRPNGETLLSCDDFGIKLKTEDYWKIVGWVR